MTRWEPGGRGRLEAAAMELYAERGYEQTTVAEIAARAGLTERTFFRHFADKREVLFAGSILLQELLIGRLGEALDSAGSAGSAGSSRKPVAPMAAVEAAVGAIPEMLTDREHSCARQAIMSANAELQERELIKLATLSAAMAGTLRERGVREPAASLAAEAGIAVFRIAFEEWVSDGNKKPLDRLIRTGFDQLKAVTSGA